MDAGNIVAANNFTKKLAKEFRRNPKKTVVLALLAVVALWFWAPLVWKWVAPQEEAAVAEVAPAAAPVAAPVSAASSVTAEPSHSLPRWSNLVKLFQSEQLMRTAELRDELGNPFATIARQPAVEEDESQEKEEAPPLVVARTPQQLGLTLSSTVIGGRTRLAMISGKMCQTGSVLVVADGGIDHEFTVARIEPNQVVLSSGTEAYPLKRRANETDIRITRAGAEHPARTKENIDRVIIRRSNRD